MNHLRNEDDLIKRFKLVKRPESPCETVYVCRSCNVMARSEESQLPCSKEWVTLRVQCGNYPVCKIEWRAELEICDCVKNLKIH